MKKCTKVLLTVIILISTLAAAPSAEGSALSYGGRDMLYPHYLKANSQRYDSFYAKNPGMLFSVVIAYVNAGVDLTPYTDISVVSDPDSVEVMLNKSFSLPLGYEPGDMVDIGGGRLMREEAAEHFLRMKEETAALGLRLYVVIGYRSYQSQARHFNGAMASSGTVAAERQFARPGHSDHQTGLAVDVLDRSWNDHMSYAKFEETREYAWLCENAYNYGFILRYPRNYGNIHGFIYEPWHWRYVGVEIATAMHEEGIAVYEEYYGKYLAPGVVERRENPHLADNRRSGLQ